MWAHIAEHSLAFTMAAPMLAFEGDYSAATIVICGGALYGAYLSQNADSPILGSCGRIVATLPDPVWEMGEMPFVQIMGDMVMLPTVEVLIINGAKPRMQGCGLMTNPCLNPVLYQPDQPEGSRFMMLNPGSIPRLYHSTKNLLPDWRVLLTGINYTNYYYTLDWDFPTELRIEAFSPEYLVADTANLRPVVVETPETVHYVEDFEVFVTVPLPMVGIVEVNLAGASFTMHLVSQGQRLIKLVVTSATPKDSGRYRIECTVPPKGMVAPPRYYMMFAVNQGVSSVVGWVNLIS